MKSIYERIRETVGEQGYVPHDFILEEDTGEEGLRFAPGALEGILGHHARGGDGDAGELAAFLKAHCGEDPEQVLGLYEKEWVESRTALVRDGILKEISENRREYDGDWLTELAWRLMTKGARTETVKMGLTLLGLFDIWEDARMRDAVTTLGYCEDFTEYVLDNLSRWPEEIGNQACFALARKLSGWGKINAVERLRADTEEIREWILCHGCRNTVMYSYLGLECAYKCRYLERLRRGGLSGEELAGAGDIMDGLLEEGPCRGISVLEDAEETVYRYLCACRSREKDVSYICQLLRIREYLAKDCRSGLDETAGRQPHGEPHAPDAEDGGELCGKEGARSREEWRRQARRELSEILASVDIRAVILRGLEEFPYDAISAAQGFDIDISDVLLEKAEKDFTKYYNYSYYFMEKKETAQRFTALCERNLDPSRIPVGMGRSLNPGSGHWPVDMTVQYLERYPGLGKELIRVSLRSPCIRWRNMAARALEGWKDRGSNAWQELYEDIAETADRECDETLRERWQRLLEGTGA